MSKTNDLVRQSPAIAITAAILAFAFGFGGSLEAQGNGCNSNVCDLGGIMGSCQFRSTGGGNDHCSCMTADTYQDTCFCSTICGS